MAHSTRSVAIAIGVTAILAVVAAVTITPSPHHDGPPVSLRARAAPGPDATGSIGARTPGDATVAAPSSTTTVGPSRGATGTTGPAAPAGPAAATTAPTTAGAPGPALTAPQPAGPAPVAPGTYHYSQSGSISLKAGPSAIPMDLPLLQQGTLVVTPASGGTQQWLRSSIVSVAPSSSATTMLFNGSGVFLVSQSLAGMSCIFAAPVPWPPWPVTVGRTFSGNANCSGTTFGVDGHVASSAPMSVGGSEVGTLQVVVNLSLNGSPAGTQTDWYAPSLRLPVRTHTTFTVSSGGYVVASDVTYLLESATPTA